MTLNGKKIIQQRTGELIASHLNPFARPFNRQVSIRHVTIKRSNQRLRGTTIAQPSSTSSDTRHTSHAVQYELASHGVMASFHAGRGSARASAPTGQRRPSPRKQSTAQSQQLSAKSTKCSCLVSSLTERESIQDFYHFIRPKRYRTILPIMSYSQPN